MTSLDCTRKDQYNLNTAGRKTFLYRVFINISSLMWNLCCLLLGYHSTLATQRTFTTLAMTFHISLIVQAP